MNRRILRGLLVCLFLAGCRDHKPVDEAYEQAWYRQTYDSVNQLLKYGADTAVYIYDSIYHSLEHPPEIARFGRYDFLHHMERQFRSNPEKAALYIDSAIRYLERHDLVAQYPKSYFDYLCSKGELALSQSNYNRAHEYYLKARQVASAYLTSCDIAAYCYSLGMVLYRQQKYRESLEYFKESDRQYATCRPSWPVMYKQQEIADNIGLCYEKIGEYDSALIYFNRTLTIIAASRDSIPLHIREAVEGVVTGNIAKVYVARNRLDTAAVLFKKSIALNIRPSRDWADAQLAQAQLAAVYGRQGRYPAMLDVLQQLKNGLDTLPNPPALLSWKQLMASYYLHTRQPLEELKYYKEFITLRDSLTRAEEHTLKTDITRQIREKEQELEIALLKKNNQLDKTYLLITAGLSVVAILVILFIYYIFRRTKRLNRLISAQKEELLQLNNVKNKLFSVVSHDMRTPVNSLSSFIYLLENRAVSQESLLAYSHQLKKSLGHTSEMMENLLNWAASQMQGFRPVIERTDILPLIEKVAGNISGLSAGKRVSIVNEVPPTTVAVIDRDMLQVIVRNLLSNAIKFSHPEGRVVISAIPAGEGHIAIAVQDHGPGLPHAYVQKINSGNPELLRSTSGTAHEKGTGLGLYLCGIFAGMMNGRLQAQSKPGETIISVILPVS
ncbi:MAG: tetratricopeptide repeat-containing sensor histidine kinase [Chitinophagaceae bacterium]